MGQVLTKNEGFGNFCEGWIPFLFEIKQKAGWLVGMTWPWGNDQRLSTNLIMLKLTELTVVGMCSLAFKLPLALHLHHLSMFAYGQL